MSMPVKMIPALIYKSEANEYEVQVYQIDSRDVLVRDLYQACYVDPLSKILNNQLNSETGSKIISSLHIQPKSRVVEEKSVTIKITDQPKKKIIYCNSVEIYRGFKAENMPYIKVLDSGGEEESIITWKSSLSFDLEIK